MRTLQTLNHQEKHLIGSQLPIMPKAWLSYSPLCINFNLHIINPLSRMTAFQIISISALTIILAGIGLQLFRLVRPRLTLPTTVLFLALVCLGFVCYFGVLLNFVDESVESRAQFWLRKISYHGCLTSLVLFVFLGLLALILMIAEYRITHITRRK